MRVVDVWSVVAAAGVLAAIVWWRPPVAGRLRTRRIRAKAAPAWLAAAGLGFFSSGAQARRREQVVMALPQACDLMGVCLEAGLPLRQAAAAVAEVVDPPLSDSLNLVIARVSLGVSEREAWADLREHPGLETLGREVGRCLSSGAALAGVLRTLAVEARREALSLEEVRAKRVGVRSVLPLMVCFLPAFVLLGVVPIIGGIVSQVLP